MSPALVKTGSDLKLSSEAFSLFSAYITQELGIKMPPEKLTLLQSRLQRRLRHLGLTNLEEYQNYLFNSAYAEREQTDFFDLVTTNKTDFFREPSHFEYLTECVLPSLSRGHCRVWCAGCSTGEEAYTLAMALSEFRREHQGFDFSIVASDISTRVLAKAKEAIYEEQLIKPIPLALRQRYLLRSKDATRHLVKIGPALRSKIEFCRLNFMAERYPFDRSFQLIFFRNVMIYFDHATQQRVLSHMCKHLVVGGHLFVGHTESLIGIDLPLRSVSSSVYQRLDSSARQQAKTHQDIV